MISRQQACAAGMSTARIDNNLRSCAGSSSSRACTPTFSGTPDRTLGSGQLAAGRSQGRAQLPNRCRALRSGQRGDSATSHHGAEQSAHPTHPRLRNALLRHASTRHGILTLVPPRTRVEETVLDLIQVSASVHEAVRLDMPCRRPAADDQRASASRACRAVKARWRKDCWLALGDSGRRPLRPTRAALHPSVERDHGLPTAQRQVSSEAGNRPRQLDNLYEEASWPWNSTGEPAIRRAAVGLTTSATAHMPRSAS